MAAEVPDSRYAFSPMLYALSASSEEVVASAKGTSNFFTVANDSPSSPRNFVAACPTASSTFSFAAAVTCSCASTSTQIASDLGSNRCVGWLRHLQQGGCHLILRKHVQKRRLIQRYG